jgi:hypothetical protein
MPRTVTPKFADEQRTGMANAAARDEIEHFISGLVKRIPGEPEFQQVVREVVETLIPFTLDNSIGV